MGGKRLRRSVVVVGFGLLSACAPSPLVGVRSEPASPGQGIPEKTLIAAIQQEPNTWDDVLTGASGSPRQGGRNQVPPLVDDGLTQVDEFNRPQRRLAAEMPDHTKGTWVLKPDGTMDVIWKLRSDAKWHDGTPVTSADFVFAYEARSNPESARTTNGGGRADLISGASAPEPHTFVAHWSVFYVEANGGGGLNPLPKHLLNELYQRSPVDLGLDKFFTTEYIGTGPYRLEQWEPGSHITFRRFEEHYLGPPKLARIIVRIIPDSNTQVANILSESVDVLLPVGVDLEAAIEIKERWAQQGTGHQVITLIGTGMEHLEIQYHPDRARPRFGLTETPVRKALYHAIDRPALADAMTRGLAPIADSIYAPDDPYRPMVRDIIPHYPFDVRRAQELLEAAGWMRGPDGIRVHQTTGERLVVQNLVRPGRVVRYGYDPRRSVQIIEDLGYRTAGNGFYRDPADQKLEVEIRSTEVDIGNKSMLSVADYWQRVGVAASLVTYTRQQEADYPYSATFPSFLVLNRPNDVGALKNLLGSRARLPEHNFLAPGVGNWSRYMNPEFDSLVAKYSLTVSRNERIQVLGQIIYHISDQLNVMGLFYNPVPEPVYKRLMHVTSGRAPTSRITWNAHDWDLN